MRIQNKELLTKYIDKHQIHKLFSADFAPEFELFEFKKDDILLTAEELAQHLFFLVEGKVKVFNYSHDGKIIFLSQLEPFQIIGETATLWGWEATANVQAVTTVHCIGIALTQYRDLLLNSVEFLKFLCRNMAVKLALQNKYFSNTIFDSLDNRLAVLILIRSNGQIFKPHLTEYAEMLCTSYRHLLRTMSKFCEKGILKKQGQSYLVVDMDALKHFAYFENEN